MYNRLRDSRDDSSKAGTTVYPKKYAHGFCFAVLCCGYTLTDLPISIRFTSLALWQSNDCPSASKATLMNMDKYFMWIHYERLHNHNKAKHNKTMCIFLGIYCTNVLCHAYHYWHVIFALMGYWVFSLYWACDCWFIWGLLPVVKPRIYIFMLGNSLLSPITASESCRKEYLPRDEIHTRHALFTIGSHCFKTYKWFNENVKTIDMVLL